MSREGIPGKEVADAGLMYGWSKAGPAKGGGCEQNSPKATMRGISAEPSPFLTLQDSRTRLPCLSFGDGAFSLEMLEDGPLFLVTFTSVATVVSNAVLTHQSLPQVPCLLAAVCLSLSREIFNFFFF